MSKQGFTFEKNLPHQTTAVNAVLGVFRDAVCVDGSLSERSLMNPMVEMSEREFEQAVTAVQRDNDIEPLPQKYINPKARILDIAMETGTGKTYTYTKTIFALNAVLGVRKFIVVVPTLAIKAGTVNFLKSPALAAHMRDEFGNVRLYTHVVESKSKSKSTIPTAIKAFVNADDRDIHILVINAGMINSKTMKEAFDGGLFNGEHDTCFGGITAVKPFVIVDEPHKFPTAKKTWGNIEKLGAQYIIRYGATFSDGYENLLYHLTAVDAFNQDLVKGISVYIEDIEGGDKMRLTLIDTNGSEAVFELNQNGKKSKYALKKDESLERIDRRMQGLSVQRLNKTTVTLSNGLEMKKKDFINPYSYDETLQDAMLQKAVKEHFKLERELLTQEVKIKPLTLFFINDIAGYRDEKGSENSLKSKFESFVKAHAKRLLKEENDPFYRIYLEKTIADIAQTHGGYFSQDNTGKDDKIEKEVQEILHDKEALLSLDNPRRFLFSKWTLKEGWDNPNVFQICKLRSSGSETSKLQEVGRGLRLPVNEYMARVKDRDFKLNYFVDFTETEFAKSLVDEINSTSYKEKIPKKLSDVIEKLQKHYHDEKRRTLSNTLYDQGIINDDEKFTEGGFAKFCALYPKAFPAIKSGKVANNTDQKSKSKTRLRTGAGEELWMPRDVLNQKAILCYNASEEDLKNLFKQCLKDNRDSLTHTKAVTRKMEIRSTGAGRVDARTIFGIDENVPVTTLSYVTFLKRLSDSLHIKLDTLHHVFQESRGEIDISSYLNIKTVRYLKRVFDESLRAEGF